MARRLDRESCFRPVRLQACTALDAQKDSCTVPPAVVRHDTVILVLETSLGGRL